MLSLPIPSVSGYFLPAEANVGEISNKGFEISATYQNSISDFSYSIGGNFTAVRNNVNSLGDIPQIITGIGGNQTHRTIEGESMGHFSDTSPTASSRIKRRSTRLYRTSSPAAGNPATSALWM